MAIARMLRVEVLAHQSVMDALVDAMQDAEVLDIERMPQDSAAPELPRDDERVRLLEERLAHVTFIRDFLGRYRTSTQSFAAFVSEKIHMSEEEYRGLAGTADIALLYQDCEEIASRAATAERERKRLLQLADDLEPWEQLRLQFSRLQDTEAVDLFTGTVQCSRSGEIRQLLRDATPYVSVEELSCATGRSAWVVMAHRSALKDVRDVLALTDFQEVSFPDLSDYPAEERARALSQAAAIEGELQALEDSARELAEADYARSVALVEAVASQLDAVTVRQRFGSTERTFLVRGWVRASQRGKLEGALTSLDTDTDLTFSEPSEDDAPPVVLENPWYIRPFETLTDLYGLPRYDEVDPTPLLAPFFLLFFSICVGDVGYGLMLIAGAWYIKHKIDVAPGVKRFMDLLMFGGAGAMVIGVLFGSYFALDFGLVTRYLPFLKPLQVLDPLQQLPVFLIVTVALGLTQVLFGVLVAAWQLARQGDTASAFFDQLSTVLLFVFIGVAVAVKPLTVPALVLGIGITVLFKGRALEAAIKSEGTAPWDRAFGLAWLAILMLSLVVWGFGLPLPGGWVLLGMTVAGLAVSKAVRRSVVALLGGLYAVYGMSAFIGDTLSYTRLAALGLSGALVGMVFNTLAGLVMGGATGLFAKGGGGIVGGIVVVVLATLVFVVGHVFNVVINLLGAFVHPARLQFVEFFSKFYEGGGRAFSPFAHRTKSLVLRAGKARQEGAGS